MDHPVMVVNPALGQLYRKKVAFPVYIRVREFGPRQVRPSCPASACSFSTLGVNLVHTLGIPPDFRGRVNLPVLIASTAIAIISGNAITYRRRWLPRVHQRRASSPQGSSNNGCFLFSYNHEPIFVYLSFSTPNIVVDALPAVVICDTDLVSQVVMFNGRNRVETVS